MKIHILQLKEGEKKSIDETLPPSCLEVNEEGLSFKSAITVHGEVSVVTGHLFITFSASTTAEMVCSICNQLVTIPIAVDHVSASLPTDEIKDSIFDLTEMVREELLLQVPQFVECSGGHCPARATVDKFLKRDGNFPFADL